MPVTAPADPYKEALERLYGLERGNKGPFGLEGTRALLADLGNPERAFQSIHVAGTNGKGSVCAMLERVLRALGWHTGLFTSPHLIDFRERIRIDGRKVAPEIVTRDLARIASVPAGRGRTFFEATFALGALAFSEAKVGVAVLETGLGGRLDATNVVTPSLCVITRIALDHQELLGDTLAAIAAEKAGILKPGIPAVVALQSEGVMEVIEARAREVGAPLHVVTEVSRIVGYHPDGPDGTEFTLDVNGLDQVRTRIGLLGPYQVGNAALAVAAAVLFDGAATPDKVAEGLAAARWPGRLERSPRESRLWWDGAHNPDGAAMLRRAWGDLPATLVLGMSADKEAAAMLAALAGPWTSVIAVAAASARALPAPALAAAVRKAWPGTPVVEAPSVTEGIAGALASNAGPVLACGSLFVVGEAMAAYGADELEQL